MEQRLQWSKQFVRLVGIGIFEEDYSSKWDSMISTSGCQIIVEILPISLYEKWRYDPFNGRVYLCHSIELKYGLLSHQTRC
jgi:hypothetical protein